MKKCNNCGCMNNQSNNYCIQCGSKITDKKTKYLILHFVLAAAVISLNIVSYLQLRDFSFDNYSVGLFEFLLFNFIPSAICIFSVIYHIVLLSSVELTKKYKEKLIFPFISILVGTALSLPSIIFAMFWLFLAIVGTVF